MLVSIIYLMKAVRKILANCIPHFSKAPEFILDNQVLQANDMFSLGCLAYAVHNKGISLLHTFNNLHTYERKIQALSTSDFTNMPTHLQRTVFYSIQKNIYVI